MSLVSENDGDSAFGDFPEDQEQARAERLRDYIADHVDVDGIIRVLKERGASAELIQEARSLRAPLDREPEQFLKTAVDVLYAGDQPRLADSYDLFFPLYNAWREYQLNSKAPWGKALRSRPRTAQTRWPFLGRLIGLPLGVPASAITGSASWIALLADSGYNVITFKTVRSQRHPEFSAPNWVSVPDLTEPLPIANAGNLGPVRGELPFGSGPSTARTASTANSFGVPSADPSDWRLEVDAALEKLDPAEQLLILSVLGDHYRKEDNPGTVEDRRREIVADFVTVALEAQRTEVQAIELNVSCPNTVEIGQQMRKPLCVDNPELVAEIVKQVRAVLDPETKLLMKLSYMPYEPLRALVAATKGAVDAYVGINTLQVVVLGDDDQSIFPGRSVAGLSGVAVREYALDFIRSLVRIRIEEDTSFDIVGMGGATDAESFAQFFRAGATVVQSATAVNSNLALARECVTLLGDSLESVPMPEEDVLERIEDLVLKVLSQAPKPIDSYAVASRMPVPFLQVDAALMRAIKTSKVRQRGHGEFARYTAAR